LEKAVLPHSSGRNKAAGYAFFRPNETSLPMLSQNLTLLRTAGLFSCVLLVLVSFAEARNGIAPSADSPFQTIQAKKKPKQVKQKTKGIDADDDGTSSRVWRLARDASGPILSFGPRKGDDSIVVFSCTPGSKQIRVVAFTASRGTKRGDAARLRLTNGRQRLEIAATAFADSRQNRIDIGGITRDTASFLDILRNGETLILETPGRKVGISLKTIGKKADQFAATCG
jgi:hypothetical protein